MKRFFLSRCGATLFKIVSKESYCKLKTKMNGSRLYHTDSLIHRWQMSRQLSSKIRTVKYSEMTVQNKFSELGFIWSV